MARKSVPDGLAADLRRAIEASGLSLNQIGQRAGMDHSRLSRFMRGERGLTIDAVQRIGQVLGLRLTLAGDATPVEPQPAAPIEEPPAAAPPPRGRPRKDAAPAEPGPAAPKKPGRKKGDGK